MAMSKALYGRNGRAYNTASLMGGWDTSAAFQMDPLYISYAQIFYPTDAERNIFLQAVQDAYDLDSAIARENYADYRIAKTAITAHRAALNDAGRKIYSKGAKLARDGLPGTPAARNRIRARKRAKRNTLTFMSNPQEPFFGWRSNARSSGILPFPRAPRNPNINANPDPAISARLRAAMANYRPRYARFITQNNLGSDLSRMRAQQLLAQAQQLANAGDNAGAAAAAAAAANEAADAANNADVVPNSPDDNENIAGVRRGPQSDLADLARVAAAERQMNDDDVDAGGWPGVRRTRGGWSIRGGRY